MEFGSREVVPTDSRIKVVPMSVEYADRWNIFCQRNVVKLTLAHIVQNTLQRIISADAGVQ